MIAQVAPLGEGGLAPLAREGPGRPMQAVAMEAQGRGGRQRAVAVGAAERVGTSGGGGGGGDLGSLGRLASLAGLRGLLCGGEVREG